MQEYEIIRLNTLNTIQYAQISKNKLNTQEQARLRMITLKCTQIHTSKQENARISKNEQEYAPIQTRPPLLT